MVALLLVAAAPSVKIIYCDCEDPIENISVCYCHYADVEPSNICEPWQFTQWEEIDYHWLLCEEWGAYFPIIVTD